MAFAILPEQHLVATLLDNTCACQHHDWVGAFALNKVIKGRNSYPSRIAFNKVLDCLWADSRVYLLTGFPVKIAPKVLMLKLTLILIIIYNYLRNSTGNFLAGKKCLLLIFEAQ